MDFLKDRRTVLVLAGAAVALVAGVIIASILISRHKGEAPAPSPASQAGLVIDSSGPDEGKMDPAKPLRCFVAGQFVGELTLGACAKRNGVSTDALDVGLDQSGALAAAQQAGPMITPLPPPDAAPTAEPPGDATSPPTSVQPSSAPAGACWRYADGQWRRLTIELSLSACVQTLFAGRCERQGGASYGRWMQQTLRLVPGRVEMSSDNRTFHMLADQAPNCAIGAAG